MVIPWIMLQSKAWCGCFGSRHGWKLCQLVVTASLEADIELCEDHEFGGESPGADNSAHPTADENKGIVELHAVYESDLSKTEAAVAAAIAGVKGNIGLFEVFESFPPLPNSSHSPLSRPGSLSSACARRVARCVAAAPARASPVVSAAVAHASILHSARNSGGAGGLFLVQRSTS